MAGTAFTALFERIAPEKIEYRHNLRWGDGNGHSHVRHSLVGPSLTIPLVDGKLTLGTWQQIVFVDFDVRHRSRSVVVQVMGEKA
jgi:secondary thiamine-phosphate synthase enzyme